MISFKSAIYEPVKLFGIDAAYTQDHIEDIPTSGYYTYCLMLEGEQRRLKPGVIEGCEAVVIFKEPFMSSVKNPEVHKTDLIFKDTDFNFEEFFEGYHRHIDFQINVAEAKKYSQIQSKSKSHTKAYSPEHT